MAVAITVAVLLIIGLVVLCRVDRDEAVRGGDVYRKIAAVSALVSGWVAIVLAFNNNGMAAGVLLIASALAFGSVLVATAGDHGN